ncbi:zinc finger protein 436-like [Belonocnema kinseyi]|uniref:zinc finger protein 436-like n=1 Tax=Belonocnema kinseyi TaxID=2817044 RepID=UPI00143D714F|nr:zinc finger protein 436-like [Belonocnema kinseyi]
MPSGGYKHQKSTFRTILEEDKELLDLPFKNNETGFTDFTEILYSSDETLEIKEENIEHEAAAGQKYNKEYDSKLCIPGIKETDDFAFNRKLQIQNKNKIQKSEQECENKFECQKCARNYKYKKTLNHHRKFLCGVTPQFICKSCGKSFNRSNNLKAHVDRVHHNTNSKKLQMRHKCNACTRSYSLLRNLSRHKSKHHSDGETQLICDYCGFKANWKSHLSAHINTSHFQTSNTKHTCNKCSRSYISLQGLIRHKRLKHASIVPYFSCGYCKFKTKQKDSLSKHTITRHLQTPKAKHYCDKCSRSYNFLNSLTRHKRVQHAAVIPQFICDICGHKANLKYNLSVHISKRHLK